MATIPSVRAATNPALQAVREAGWRRGFANLLRNENRLWWGTCKWLIHLLLWLIVLNGLILLIGIPMSQEANHQVPHPAERPPGRSLVGLVRQHDDQQRSQRRSSSARAAPDQAALHGGIDEGARSGFAAAGSHHRRARRIAQRRTRSVAHRRSTMFTHLTNSAKAFLFFVIAFGLTVTISLLYPLLGEITAIIHMFTPALSVLIMMLVVTGEGYTKTSWATLGLHRAGLR
jgi:hypothetical protein